MVRGAGRGRSPCARAGSAASARTFVESEPPSEDDPLLSAPHSLITPHIAWMTDGARRNIISITLENIRRFKEGNPQNVVNREWLKAKAQR